MTVHDIRFSDDGAGINICCSGNLVDPFNFYDPKFLRSENLTTFMQLDSITMDLGYVRNNMFTRRYDEGSDYPADIRDKLLQARLPPPVS